MSTYERNDNKHVQKQTYNYGKVSNGNNSCLQMKDRRVNNRNKTVLIIYCYNFYMKA